MHHAFHRRMRVVADRIAQFVRRDLELARIGAKLRGDRIVRIGRIDQRVHRRRDRDGVARGDFAKRQFAAPLSALARVMSSSNSKRLRVSHLPPPASAPGSSSSAMKCGPRTELAAIPPTVGEKPKRG